MCHDLFFLWTTEESELCEMVALDNDNNQHTFTRLVLVCIKRIWNRVPIKKKNMYAYQIQNVQVSFWACLVFVKS